MKKEALIEFVKTNDFAYVYGAGIGVSPTFCTKVTLR